MHSYKDALQLQSDYYWFGLDFTNFNKFIAYLKR